MPNPDETFNQYVRDKFNIYLRALRQTFKLIYPIPEYIKMRIEPYKIILKFDGVPGSPILESEVLKLASNNHLKIDCW